MSVFTHKAEHNLIYSIPFIQEPAPQAYFLHSKYRSHRTLIINQPPGSLIGTGKLTRFKIAVPVRRKPVQSDQRQGLFPGDYTSVALIFVPRREACDFERLRNNRTALDLKIHWIQ